MKKKLTSLLLALCLLLALVPTVGLTAGAAEPETQTLYYGFTNIVNYKAFVPGETYLFVKNQASTYSGKDAILTVPQGSAFLDMYKTIDQLDTNHYADLDEYGEEYADEWCPTCTADLTGWWGWTYYMTGSYYSDKAFYADPAAIASFTEADYVARYAAFCDWYWNESLPAADTWAEFRTAAIANAKTKAEALTKAELGKDTVTDEEVVAYINTYIYDKYEGYYAWSGMKKTDVEGLVDVAMRGAGFDSCVQGQVGYRTLTNQYRYDNILGSGTASGTGWWYSCNGGGVYYVGPFNAYSYKTATFSAEDVIVNKTGDEVSNPVQKDEITVSVKVDGTKYAIPESEYEIIENDPEDGITVTIGTVTADTAIQNKPVTNTVTFAEDNLSDGTTTTTQPSIASGAASYESGESVTVTAGNIDGYMFTGWTAAWTEEETAKELADLDVTVGDENSESVTFTMPESAVTLTANYITAYDVILSGMQNGSVTVSARKGVEGDVITVTTAPNANYVLESLKVCEDGDETAEIAVSGGQFTMPAHNVRISAAFRYVQPTEDAPYTVPVTGSKDTVNVEAQIVGTNINVEEISEEEIAKISEEETVVLDLSSLPAYVTGVTIPKETFETLAASEAEGLEIRLPSGTTVVFDRDTLNAVAEQAQSGSIRLVVNFEQAAEETLSSAQKNTIEKMNEPTVLDAYFVSNGVRISDFQGGETEITASYETSRPVRVWYVADDGSKELIPSSYDGSVTTFTVKHFSHYVIEQLDGCGCACCSRDENCVYAQYADADTDAWYHDGLHYCVENGYMQGYTDGQMKPDGRISRAQIVTILWRMENSPVVNYAMSFSDVAEGQWYTEAIRWAQSTGVVEGYADGSFGPNDAITREQLAAILCRYAREKGMDVSAAADLSVYTDAAGISSYAGAAMAWANAAGIVTGRTATDLVPTGTATRAEAACMIQRFCEGVEE